MTGVLAPLRSGWTYRRWVHLLLGGVLLLPYGLLARGVAREFEPDAAPFVLSALILMTVGVAVLIGLVPGVRVLEVAAARRLLGVELPEQTLETARAWPVRWRSAGWLLVNMVTGGVATAGTLLVLPAVAALAAAPFRAHPSLMPGSPGWVIPAGWAAAWAPLAGLGLLIVLIYLVAGLGVLLTRGAVTLLGRSAADELAALRLRAAALADRNRLARELHDSIRHALTVSTVQASAARRMQDSDPRFVESALATIEQTGRNALNDLKHVLSLLQDEPASSGPQRGLDAVASLVAETRAAGVPVRLKVSGSFADVPAAASREAYRIVQEGLGNARRHAGPVPVVLRLAVTRDALEVELTNPVEAGLAVGQGRGLTGMRERVEALRGVMSAEPRAGQFRVAVRLPL
ncbi:MAG: sensor histidine kinase [Pseudonocardiaceae bacterium]